MKTQISVLVKAESMISKGNSNRFLGPFALLTKSKVIMVLDGKEHELVENKTPYVFDVEPGEHQIQFIDPKKANKDFARSVDKVFTGTVGAIVGAAGGSLAAADVLSDVGTLFDIGEIKGGAANILMREGDVLKLSCKGNSSGIPKVTVLKK